MEYQPLTPELRPALEHFLRDVETFEAEEIEVALELADIALGRPEQPDYHFILAVREGRVLGYICYGPTPMTSGTFDLYWLAVHPDAGRQGIGRTLVQKMEEALALLEARLVRVETSSRGEYQAARAFYASAGYTIEARLADFYSPGDDLCILTRRINQPSPSLFVTEGREFAELYDLAFCSERDFEAECDFLTRCARRFGHGAPQRVIEWASGPARHLETFARRELTDCVGVDLSPVMTRIASDRLAHLPNVRIIQGDMTTEVVKPEADLAYTMLSSIHYLPGEDALGKHLNACARSLRPGGLYVIEATHPRDLTREGAHTTSWEIRARDHHIKASFKIDLTNPSGLTFQTCIRLDDQHGEHRRQFAVNDPWLIPDADAWDRVVSREPLFETVARLGDFDTSLSWTHPNAWRLILVLRRV